MQSIVSFVFLEIILSSCVFTQNWINNDVSSVASNFFVHDLVYENNNYWLILDGNKLLETNHSMTNMYFLRAGKKGPLSDFVKTDTLNDKLALSSALTSNGYIWILDKNSLNFFRIHNDSADYITYQRNNFDFYNNFDLDVNGYLWFMENELVDVNNDGSSDKISNKLLHYSEGRFCEFTSPKEIGTNQILGFKHNVNNLFIVYASYKRDENFILKLLSVKNGMVEANIDLDTIASSNFQLPLMKMQFDLQRNVLYILSSDSQLYTYDSGTIRKYSLKLPNLSDCYWFVPYEKNVYITFDKGIYSFDVNSRLLTELHLPPVYKGLMWKKIVLIDSNIYGMLGEQVQYECELSSINGIAIYKPQH